VTSARKKGGKNAKKAVVFTGVVYPALLVAKILPFSLETVVVEYLAETNLQEQINIMDVIMVELAGEGRACIPVGLTKTLVN